MRLRDKAIVAVAVVCLAAPASWADLGTYSQDFEGLDMANPDALANDGWLVFGNVFFNPDGSGGYWYGYGPFGAPNGGEAFSAIVAGQGGPPQGEQQLSVYSDYANGDQAANLLEANVFQEQVVGAADVGDTWRFSFDHKRGNIEGQTTAFAFIKTLITDPCCTLTNFIMADMTNIPDTWGGASLSIDIDPSLEGQVLQFGFLSNTTGFQGSGIVYDNINFRLDDPLLVVLESFEAEMTRQGALITWSTAVELDTVGFRVLRETGSREKALEVLTPGLIPASGTEFNGSDYELLDTSARIGGVVRYYLEDVDLQGRVTRHGPIELVRPNSGRRAFPR